MKKLVSALLLALVLALPASAAIRIGVVDFKSGVGNLDYSIVEGLNSMFVTELTRSPAFQVFEREQLGAIAREHRLTQSALASDDGLVKIGQLAGLQAIITGSITQYSEETSGGAIPIAGIAIGAVSNTGTVTMDVRVIDVNTGAIRFALREKGVATSSGGGVVSGFGGFATGKHGGTGYAAAEKAVRKVVRSLERRLGGMSYEVVDIQAKHALISAGSDKGVQKGDLFVISVEGKAITDSRGQVLGVEKIYYGALKATDVQPGFSRCSYVKGQGLIRKGDLIEPVDSAKELKAMEFAASRQGSGKSDELTENLGSKAPEATASQTVSTESKPTEKPVETPKPAETPAAVAVEGVDPNTCTDAKLIETYDLPATTKRTLVTIYNNGMKHYKNKRYKNAMDVFVRSASDKSGDVLNTYWAGMAALKTGRKKDARMWFEEVLRVNPTYEPAKKALGSIK